MKMLETFKKQFISKDTGKSLKRKKFCRFTKGEHEFEIVIPKDYASMERYKRMTVDEFYKQHNSQTKGYKRNWDIFYHKCKHCGKEKFEIVKKVINNS